MEKDQYLQFLKYLMGFVNKIKQQYVRFLILSKVRFEDLMFNIAYQHGGVLPSCWNAPVNMIYKEMDWELFPLYNLFSDLHQVDCHTMSFPSMWCLTVRLEFP